MESESARVEGSAGVAYFNRVAKPGENLLARGRLHWIIYANAFLPLALAIGVAIAGMFMTDPHVSVPLYIAAVLLGLLALWTFLARFVIGATTEFTVTDHRVIVKRGLFSLHTIEIAHDKIESVDVDQTLLGRMLGYGTVTIRGVGSSWDPIPQIADPIAFRNAITVH